MTLNDKMKVVKTQLEDGTYVYVQTTTLAGEDYIVDTDKVYLFEEVTHTIKSIAKSVVDTLKEVKPRSATVEFGLEVSVEAGKLTTLLVKGSGTANLKITLEWGEIDSSVTR
jgi:hypothetical protein